MWSRVRDFIRRNKLLNTSDLYLVALSGGADSVALLLLLREEGYRLEAVHCNFHLRGDESDRDEQFCVALCEREKVPLHRVHFDTQTFADVHKISIEMAARELRYQYFEQLRKDIGAAGVCVAHHRDDSVETVVMNLIRGTGLRGLTGIQPRNGTILRPLLCVSRQEIEAFLRERGQEFVTDSSNLQADVVRNKVRLQVLPLLKTLNPAVVENVQRTAEHLAEAQRMLDGVMKDYEHARSLDVDELRKHGSSEYVLFEWLRNYGFNGSQAEQMLEAETGSVFTSPTGFDVLVDRGRWVVEPSLKPMKPVRIPETGTYIIGEADGTADQEARMVVGETVADGDFQPSRLADSVTLDAAKVRFPLTVRRAQQGDWMVPFGMKGRKLLSDMMTDRKMSVFEKRRQLVVVDAEGKVVWLVGLRTDNRCRVDSATRRVLTLQRR